MAHWTVRWCTGDDSVHCPVPATSAERWGLERLTVEVFCLLATSDSPVCSDFATLTSVVCAFTVHHSRPLRADDRCSVSSPNMSGAHRIVRWIIAERLPENPESSQFGGAWPGHRTVSGAPLAAPRLVFCSKRCRVPNLIYLLVYVGLYAPEINDN
jgi:hypothetical protein